LHNTIFKRLDISLVEDALLVRVAHFSFALTPTDVATAASARSPVPSHLKDNEFFPLIQMFLWF
jgi:hypothetical protein